MVYLRNGYTIADISSICEENDVKVPSHAIKKKSSWIKYLLKKVFIRVTILEKTLGSSIYYLAVGDNF
jgi:hypothetical protein